MHDHPPPITDFLLARITEDEFMAAAEVDAEPGWTVRAGELGEYATRLACPQRVLAECRAKRSILAEHPSVSHWGPGDQQVSVCDQCSELLIPERHLVVPYPCPTVQHLAAVYSDHPDYREDWRPLR